MWQAIFDFFEPKEKTHEKAVLAVSDALSATPNTLKELPLLDKFKDIRKITRSVLKRFPVQKKYSDTPIDESAIPKEIAALTKLSGSILCSDAYRNLLVNITTDAIEALFQDTKNIAIILSWQNSADEKGKIKLLQTAHELFIESARNHLGNSSPIVKALEPTRVKAFSKPRQIHPETGKTGLVLGFADTSVGTYPGYTGISINTHPDAEFSNPAKALSILFHESGHCIEGLLAYHYNIYRKNVPEEFKQDAEVFYVRDKVRAHISSRIYSGYRAQCNETACFAISDYAEAVIAEKAIRLALQ